MEKLLSKSEVAGVLGISRRGLTPSGGGRLATLEAKGLLPVRVGQRVKFRSTVLLQLIEEAERSGDPLC